MPDARASAPKQHVGSLTITGPWLLAPGRWRVEAYDNVLEDAAHKDFGSQGKAFAFIAGLVTGQAEPDPLAVAIPNKRSVDAAAGAFGQLAQSPQLTRQHTRDHTPGVPRDPATSPFNLRAVRDVLTAYELDPFAEIAEVLMRKAPARDRSGAVLTDDEGKAIMSPQIGGLERAKVLIELAQYITPKLKAVEMKVEDKRTLTDEQLADRIGALTAKLVAAANLPPVNPEGAT